MAVTTTVTDVADSYYSESVDRYKTPNYFERIAKGEIIPSLPYSKSVNAFGKRDLVLKTYTYPGGSYIGSSTKKNWSIQPYIGACEAALKADIPYYKGLGDNKLLSKIQGSSLPIIMMIWERKQTEKALVSFLDKTHKALKFIRNPKKFFSIYKGHPPRTAADHRWLRKANLAAKRSYLPEFKHRFGTYGDLWLEYRYAWFTSYMDIRDSLKAYEDQDKKQHSLGIKAGIGHKDEKGDFIPFSSTAGPFSVGPFYNKELLLTGTMKVSGSVGCVWRVSNTINAALGSLQNGVSFVYDALPWTFVLDWAVDIAKYLDLYDACFGLDFVSGFRSTKIEYEYESVPAPRFRIGATQQGQVTNGLPKNVRLSFSREILTSFPTPTLEIPLKMTGKRMLDSLALLRQKLLKKL